MSPDIKRQGGEAVREGQGGEASSSHAALVELPVEQFVELPGRPSVLYQLKDYSRHAGYKQPEDSTISRSEGAKACREELPFLFRAFEAGHPPPPAPGSKEAEAPRASTIHEYLDWTVGAAEATAPDELSFDGFRVIVLHPRYRPSWPPPNAYNYEEARPHKKLGAPRGALPPLMAHGKPLCAATIRSGRGFLEIPFFATQENKKSRGYGRCLLEAIEDVARCLRVHTLMLCSTDDEKTLSIWNHFGFQRMEEHHWGELQIEHSDMLYMDNTVQLFKRVPDRLRLTSIIIKHQSFVQRVYSWSNGGPPAKRPSLSHSRFDSGVANEAATSLDDESNWSAQDGQPAPKAAGPAGSHISKGQT